MYNEEDLAEKIQARAQRIAQQQNKMADSGASFGGLQAQQAMREGLRERLATRLMRAQQEERRLRQTSELVDLLDKNPEIARILDLLETVGQ